MDSGDLPHDPFQLLVVSLDFVPGIYASMCKLRSFKDCNLDFRLNRMLWYHYIFWEFEFYASTSLQEPLLKEYPSKLLFTTLQCVFSTIQSFFIALTCERDFSRWKLSFDISLISVAYCVSFHPNLLMSLPIFYISNPNKFYELDCPFSFLFFFFKWLGSTLCNRATGIYVVDIYLQ